MNCGGEVCATMDARSSSSTQLRRLVIEASSQSLKKVMITQGTLAKDLLQTGLKPVLLNLGDHKKVSVASLQGLVELLMDDLTTTPSLR